jgi:hypothetical protein
MEEHPRHHHASEVVPPNYVIISADTHCGADILQYKPYLEHRYHDEFDAWAADYHDAWGDLDTDTSSDYRVGALSFSTSLNWDSEKRQEVLDEQGIAGEVLFPNTAPPFFPSGAVGAPSPQTPREFEYRSAGLRAHNRWLADFCAEVPHRRAGLAQIFLNDVDQAVAEVRWAKEAGLKGVLLPADHVLVQNLLYYPRYERLWAACAETEMPVHRHANFPGEAVSDEAGDVGPSIGFLEVAYFSSRGLAQMIRPPPEPEVRHDRERRRLGPSCQGTAGRMGGPRQHSRHASLPVRK